MEKRHSKKLLRLITLLLVLLPATKGFAQLSYPSGTHSYALGTAIVPLTATNTGTILADGQTSTLAGSGSVGAYNGTGTGATFNHPIAVAADASGNIYVADRMNYLLRKIAPGGAVTTVPGTSFQLPNSVAIDAAGNIYVADEWANKIIKINTSGTVSTYAGTGSAGSANGSAGSATFNYPFGIAIDQSGNLYVAEVNNNDIRVISPSGTVSTLAGSGSAGYANGTGTSASFNQPLAVAVDAAGYVYVADASNHMIRKITPGGIVTTLAGVGYGTYANGPGTSAGFNHPAGVAVDAAGNVYVGDENNNMIRKITPAGDVSTLAGTGSSGSANGAGSAATFNYPCNIAVDASGTVYVADYNNNMVRAVATGGYSITPALPQGLVFDTSTGTISGTPTVNTVATPYTVTALNVLGPAPATVTIATGQVDFAPSDENFIITYTPRTGISDITQIAGTGVGDVNRTVAYFDGLGRPMQTVNWKATPNQNDLVLPNEYDAYGREAKKYLPYADNVNANNGAYKTDALQTNAGVRHFYQPSGGSSGVQQSGGNGIVIIPNPYAETKFEASPLNRVTEQGAPGDSWQLGQRTSGLAYMANDNNPINFSAGTGYPARLYQVTIDANGIRSLVDGGSDYPAGQLTVTVSHDENYSGTGKAGTVEEYKDKEGHVVLKRTFNLNKYPDPNNPAQETLSTYYVYDDLGNLAFVLPPGATPDAGLSSASNQTALNNFCYQYNYDERNRLVQKRVPGKDWELMVYNQLDQPVLTQDGNQRSGNQWTVTKYDALGRVIMTGLWNAGSPISQATLQASIYGAAQWDTRDYGNTTTGYSVSSYPTSLNNILTVNYYDDYNSVPGMPTAYDKHGSYSTMTKGLATASSTAILLPDGTVSSDRLLAVHYYDDEGRVVKTFSQHYLKGLISVNNYDEISNTYNFDNSVATTTRQHHTDDAGGAATLKIADNYTYDHMGRKTQTDESINDAPAITLSKTEYNEIGQLYKKHLHSTNGSSYLQDITYAYNERGWLKNSDASLFHLQLNYNDGTYAQFNGNIANQLSTINGQAQKVVTYTYDNLNRLTSGNSTGGESETGITYDPMGNITALNRSGVHSANLAYGYAGNQLQTVTNSGSSFRSYGTYDPNGNAPSDGQTHNISYNLLNLPMSIPSLNLSYAYDASGRKLRKVSGSNTTEYVDGIQYNGTTIDFVQNEEGRVLNPTSSPNYEYSLADHLGNTRVTFDSSTGASAPKQADDYYPFGYESSVIAPGNKNNYLYNKKELQDELNQYDYGARFYDPVIARWTSVDPKAESSRRWNVYNYAINNPIRFVDPDGKEIINIEGGVRFTGEDAKIAFTTIRQQSQSNNPFKIHFVYESKTKEIYKNTLNAFRKGQPQVLHYDSNKERQDQRRKAATSTYPSVPGLSKDEYPYASTFEGGAGATVANVPVREQSSQGGSLSGLYRTMTQGEAFVVIPVPKDREPDKEPQPITNPFLKPTFPILPLPTTIPNVPLPTVPELPTLPELPTFPEFPIFL